MKLPELLAQNPYIGTLSPEDRATLAAAMQVSEVSQGHVFIQEGAAGDTLYFLLDGEVMVTRERGGSSHALKLLRPGEWFGLIALVDNAPRSATCRAAGTVRVASLSAEAFGKLFFAHTPIGGAFQLAAVAQLTDDFRSINRQIRAALARRR
jgi:CRP-like cAMP-binding protein